MRIVGGKYKGRILNEFSLSNIRPTADNVRENLFNILGNRIIDCSFLDLYSGTGAVGIEAISRGALNVVFNDLSRESLNLTKDNLKKLCVDSGFETSNFDGKSYLQNSNKKFDFIFIDPPYKESLQYESVFNAERLLNDDGIIVLEDEKPFEYDIDTLIKFDERKYGRVYLSFLKRAIPQNKSCIFAGTFDPVTNGHLWVVKECLKRYKKVYVCIGINSEKTPLFTIDERLELLRRSIKDEVIIDSYSGLTVDYMKEHNIDVSVRGIRDGRDYKYEKKMLEYNKSIYKDFQCEFLYPPKNKSGISSTKVRENILSNKIVENMLPKEVENFIKEKLSKEDR